MVDWKNCLQRLCQMRFMCTHIYREGNHVADVLASFGADISLVGEQTLSRNEENKDELLASLIGTKLPHLSPEADHTCKFRVANKLVRDNENAFVPHVVSIGPYHHGGKKLQGMEQMKLWNLECHLDCKPTPDTSLVKSREEFLRNCYDEKFDLSSDNFVEMMVVDGCYILELFRKRSFCLPWQVLDCLFNLTKTSQEVSLYQLTKGLSGMKHSPLEKCVMRNLLDAVRNSLVGSLLKTRSYDEIGVKFRSASNDRDLSDITFKLENGVMEIPYVMIRSNTESLFRNLIAYEQCLDSFDKCAVLSYAMLLNQLIKSAKDLDSLIQKGIIDTELSEEDTVCFFNRLRYSTERINFFYSSLAQQVNECYRRRWLRRWFARIKRDYLYNPKSILSLFSNAVILALILTVVQTVYGILAYYKPN
ncbi:hypothetical protein D8674_041702 [Pyrus ussuriensis x Pyrus communis]|uniref:Uncharacterized protein n=1 Tax=Pyrus ussuriensis x Pyrus communis TaxID=2448454 RepID=A0A5N5GAK7_9ROSA|nr:hypothetical protein D8674_041702 [Pyrus ussuriensis x Pyrus communis]